ncbi:MAG: C4-type zinc ribbon domain-containing protein [Dictyoglomaceae bacterium]
MKKENIPKFLNIQNLIIRLKERERIFNDKNREYEEYRSEKFKSINLKEEELKNLEKTIKDLKSEQKEREDRISILREKYQAEEKKALFLKNPKEALHIEKEMENLKNLIKKLEDEVLEIMIELENKNNIYMEYKKEISILKEEFYLKETEYKEELDKLKEEINLILLEIEKNKQEISSDEIMEFENLMKQKSDKAISRVIDKEICEGCKLSLPKLILDRLKKKEELIHCPNCGRILWIE